MIFAERQTVRLPKKPQEAERQCDSLAGLGDQEFSVALICSTVVVPLRPQRPVTEKTDTAQDFMLDGRLLNRCQPTEKVAR